MQLSMWSRKRPLLHGHDEEPTLCSKRNGRDSRSRFWARASTDPLCERLSSWADTPGSVQKVLQRFKFQRVPGDIFLQEAVNEKFLAFRRDITEECGAEEKQHSWAVVEKREEVVMFGPYYPDYSSGDHSEDMVAEQTQELLQSEDASPDWKLYVFTVNSPCLARNTEPCMMKLLHRAQEWWRRHGLRTHVGFVRSWGFKGNKENVFRDLSYQQLDRVRRAEDYEGFVSTAGPDLRPVCELRFSAAKRLLDSGDVSFPLSSLQGQDWRSHSRSLLSGSEDTPEEERTALTQEVNSAVEAALAQLPDREGGFEECLGIGTDFARSDAFGRRVSGPVRDHMRLVFQQRWREMVQDRYAEIIRDKLTEDFNRLTVALFINDVAEFTEEFLQIGMIRPTHPQQTHHVT